jgi:two-component system sensor histidine kinase KdpD
VLALDRFRTPLGGIALGLAVSAVATAGLLAVRADVSSATPALVLILPGVIAAVVAGRVAAGVVAVVSALAFGFWFLPPFGEWKVLDAEDVVALLAFVAVALVVGELTAREADGRRAAVQQNEALVALNTQLEEASQNQARMATELEKLAVMEEVDRQRSALLRSVSHDLRTPLATIRAVSSDLRDGVTYDDATRTELLGLVSDEAERLDRLVANLLSMSRIEAGAFAPDRQAVDLEELITTAAGRIARALRERRVELELDPDLPLVDVDYTQIDQVVTNLLENAARHSAPRSTVRVTARAKDDGWVTVAVEDSGTGVLPTERQRIFEAFHRSDGSRSSGIGLAICKAVVEAHGGTIAVHDTPGGGAHFVFTLPVHPSNTEASR